MANDPTAASVLVPSGATPDGRCINELFGRLAAAGGLYSAGRAVVAVLLAFAATAILILIAGKNPITAYWALLDGAFGSFDHITFALNKSTPYILTAVGVALCFRAQIINIGGEGQIAVGGLATSWVALNYANLPPVSAIALALAAGIAAGALWALIAVAIRLWRGVHEVLSTLLLNFVGVLLVSEALNGSMGEVGAGFPQSPMFDDAVCLPTLFTGSDLHVGLGIALVVAFAAQFLLWRTRFGFRLRLRRQRRRGLCRCFLGRRHDGHHDAGRRTGRTRWRH